MRAEFISELLRIARLDERVLLLTGDIGYRTLEVFSNEFPDRFFNVGVAEQNMVGIATGLAESGFIPFVYSIVPFACLRPYEFIRNGPITHNLKVRIVGVGGGMDYSHDGLTHYGLEDIAVMRAQPKMTVIVPCNGKQAASALASTYDKDGAIYYRLEKTPREDLLGFGGDFVLGRSELISEGSDLLIIAAGSISNEAVKMARLLEKKGFSSRVLVVSTLNPTPEDDLVSHLRNFKNVVTIESHYKNGGLGSLVAEVIADNGLECKLYRNAVSTMPDGRTGSREFLEKLFELNAESIEIRALNLLKQTLSH